MPATILVVEDEGDIAILLRYNLEAEGFRVVTAETGDEAQHAIGECHVRVRQIDVLLRRLVPGDDDVRAADEGCARHVLQSVPCPSISRSAACQTTS